jgi:hypothetical protein
MKRFLTACAVALMALSTLNSCSQGNNSIQYATGATITSLAPSGVLLGNGDFIITVTASAFNGFKTNTVVQWNEKTLESTPLSSTTITAKVPASLVAKSGTAYINTYTPQSGTGQNGLSNSLAFLIYGSPNPVPSLSSITPASVPACVSKCSNVNITLTGTDFLPSSTNGPSIVTYTGVATSGIETAITAQSISSTEIKATIPGTYLAKPDPDVHLNVINPPSGVCIVHCPDLGGGNTGNGVGGNNTTQKFTITGSGSATTAAAVAEETPALSQDGRYVVFTSVQNDIAQVVLRDTCVGVEKDKSCSPSTKAVSATIDGAAGNADSHTPVISADGRFVAFSSAATNLVEGAAKGKQVYIRDTCIGAPPSCKPSLELVSVDPEGALNGTEAILPSISSSGRFVAFVAVTLDASAKTSQAITTETTNSGLRQVFLRDTCLGTANCAPKTTRISLQPGDAPANSTKPAGPALSGLAKQIALAGGKSSTVFTPTVPVDDQVFLALPKEPK